MGKELKSFFKEGRKLDADVLSRFQKLAPEFRKKAAEQTEKAKGEIGKLYTQIMVDLLGNSPEFEIKQLDVRTEKGNLSGRAKLTFGGPGKNPAANILAPLFSIEASAEISVSEALFYLVAENVFRDASTQDSESAKTRANGLVKMLMGQNILFRRVAHLNRAQPSSTAFLLLTGASWIYQTFPDARRPRLPVPRIKAAHGGRLPNRGMGFDVLSEQFEYRLWLGVSLSQHRHCRLLQDLVLCESADF